MIKKIIKFSIICLSFQSIAAGMNAFKPASSSFLDKKAKGVGILSSTDRVQYVKDLYYEVNGYPDDYDLTGRPQPYLEMINSSLGEYGIGGSLFSLGHETCESIPSSGSGSGLNGSTLTFSSSTKSVPSYYITDSSETMDKRIVMSQGTNSMEVELKCNDDSAIQTGYLRFTDTAEPNIVYEGYFQQNTTTSAVNVDIYIKTYTGSNSPLLIATQFSTADGEFFTIYSAYISLANGANYLTGVNGVTNGKAKVSYLNTYATSGDEFEKSPHQFVNNTLGYVDCVDVPTAATATGCENLAAPGSLTIGGVTNAWSVQTLKQVAL